MSTARIAMSHWRHFYRAGEPEFIDLRLFKVDNPLFYGIASAGPAEHRIE